MCRAVWVVVVAPADAAKQIRRAIGPDAQVVLVTDDPTDPAVATTQCDVVVLHADAAGARGAAATVQGSAVLWVGPDAPAEAHHAVEPSDDLSGAVTTALIASKRAG